MAKFSIIFTSINKLQWKLDNSNCRGPPTSLSYEKFELWVILSLCFSHVATVASPFHSGVFHFLAKLSKICEIFFSCEKKTMKLSLSHKNVNTSSHRKGNLMALTAVYQFELWLKVRNMPSKLSLPRQELYLLYVVMLTDSLNKFTGRSADYLCEWARGKTGSAFTAQYVREYGGGHSVCVCHSDLHRCYRNQPTNQ